MGERHSTPLRGRMSTKTSPFFQGVFMSAPFVLNLRTNFYQQGGGVKKWRGQ